MDGTNPDSFGIITLCERGVIPGFKFEVTMFMEQEKKFDSFVDATRYLFQRIAEERRNGWSGRLVEAIWISVFFDDREIMPLMLYQIANIARSIGLFTENNELVDPAPPPDMSVLMDLLTEEMNKSCISFNGLFSNFRAACQKAAALNSDNAAESGAGQAETKPADDKVNG